MWICSSVDAVASVTPPVHASSVAIGVFDGVHKGHRALLRETLAHRPPGGQAVVCTFDPHPKSILRPDQAPRAIASLSTRLSLFEQLGLDGALVHPFDNQAALESAASFIERVLVRSLHAKHVLVGEGFVFGHKRSGSVQVLEEFGRKYDFAVHALAPVTTDAALVSSSRVRQALGEGHLRQANEWLQAPYPLRGLVVTGDKRGRTLGFPTANVACDVEPLLPYGVYAARATWPGHRDVMAAVSIGVHPTFERALATKVEAYLINAGTPDLYGHEMTLHFCERIRGELRFESVDALVEQMHKDVKQVYALLSAARSNTLQSGHGPLAP